MSNRPMIRNRDAALYGGILLLIGGSVLLYDAYEARGRSRPWFTKLLPGA